MASRQHSSAVAVAHTRRSHYRPSSMLLRKRSYLRSLGSVLRPVDAPLSSTYAYTRTHAYTPATGDPLRSRQLLSTGAAVDYRHSPIVDPEYT